MAASATSGRRPPRWHAPCPRCDATFAAGLGGSCAIDRLRPALGDPVALPARPCGPIAWTCCSPGRDDRLRPSCSTATSTAGHEEQRRAAARSSSRRTTVRERTRNRSGTRARFAGSLPRCPGADADPEGATDDAPAPSELEDVIGEVAASYGAGRLIDSLSSAQLPNKRQVIEALNHLKAVMYLGYYATGELHEQKLRYAVSAAPLPGLRDPGRADPAGGQLRGLPLDQRAARRRVAGGCRHRVPAQDAAHPRMLSKDVLAAFHGDPAANSVEEVIFSYPSIEAITIHRIAHELHVQGVPMMPRIMTEHAHSRVRHRHPSRARRSASRSSSTTAPAW